MAQKGGRDDFSLAPLEVLYEHWSRRTEKLEEVDGHEGLEAVTPVLRYEP